jgi:hypothetical protein
MPSVLHTEQISPVETRPHTEHFLLSEDGMLRRTFDTFIIEL